MWFFSYFTWESRLQQHLAAISMPPKKFNISPGNGWLEDYFPFVEGNFQGRTVQLRGCSLWKKSGEKFPQKFRKKNSKILRYYMGVSKNRGTPKWMVYNGKPYLKWMIWGYPYFSETSTKGCWAIDGIGTKSLRECLREAYAEHPRRLTKFWSKNVTFLQTNCITFNFWWFYLLVQGPATAIDPCAFFRWENTSQEQLNMLLHLPTRNAYATLPTPNDYAMPPPKLNGLRNY